MDEEDYRALVALVKRELNASGAAELADDRHFAVSRDTLDEAQLLPPKEHLIELLRAFSRLMAVQDRHTYNVAIKDISNNVRDGPSRAVVVPLNGSSDRSEIDLGQAPDLQALRSDLHTLIGQLAETRGPPEPFRDLQ